MKVKILDLIDFEKVDNLLEGFNKSTGFVTAIVDFEGNVLSKSGWRKMCIEFHRIHPETAKKCTISDTELAGKLAEGEKYHFYKCLNGLIDVAVPIVIKGEHIANLFSGQFFLEEPDRHFFKVQAGKYGFDEDTYLKALEDVPVVSKEKVLVAMDFLLDMTQMISEITQQKLEQMKLNEAARASERDLRNSQQIAHLGSWRLDLATDHVTWTEELYRMYDADPALPPPPFTEHKKLFAPASWERLSTSFAHTTETGAPYELELETVRKDGSGWMWVRGEVEKDTEGNIIGLWGAAQDITERKLAEEKRIKLESQLRQSHKMEAIGTMAGGIAHDFNNLLAIISSNIDVVQYKQQTGSNPKDNIGHIKEAARRAKTLVTQILAFSRQEKHDLSPVDLSIVVDDSLKLLRSTIPVSVEILVEVESDPVFINADTTQIQQVLINLCANAVHAMDEKGLLRVSLGKVEPGSQSLPEGLEQQPGDYAKLSVSDTGCGIAEEDIDRIFEPFFTTKDVGMGTGMGLSAAYGIVEQHGGVITVDSTPGQGTTFNLFFSLIEEPQHFPKIDTEGSLPTGTERILFVDDEECITESCCELLEYQGYTVTSTTSSSEALDLFQKTPTDFDLVFTDQTMPGMTGVELAEELLKIRPDIPIILCSGYAAKVSEDVAKGIGICEFCIKPMDIKQLATVARKILDENDFSS